MRRQVLDRLSLAPNWFVIKEGLRNLAKANRQQRPVLVLSLKHLKQRYLFLIAQSFMRAGFFVLLDRRISRQSYWDTDGYARLVFEEPHLKAVDRLPEDCSKVFLCLDHEGIPQNGWRKVIRVDYDIQKGLSLPGAIVAPYWMHPNVYRSSLVDTIHYWRLGPRPVRLFFAGNLSRDRYSSTGPLLNGKLNRLEILEYILKEFASDTTLVQDPGSLKEILGGGSQEKIVIFDGTKARLGREEWFPALGRCEYFLAMPGVRMPMSHNLIEAMALGSIPVLNYPDWLSPCLVHGENCLAFSERESVGQAVEAVLKATHEDTRRLRGAVLDYFDTYMPPSAFIGPAIECPERLVTVYVNAEEVSEQACLAAKNVVLPGFPWVAPVAS
jgi:hypothetical protein